MTSELLSRQMDEHGWITNFVDNTKKRGEAKLTPAYLKTRIGVLEGYWSSFVARHDELYPHRSTLKEQEYFKGQVFQVTEEAYCDARTWHLEKIAKIEYTLPRTSDANSSANPNQAATVFDTRQFIQASAEVQSMPHIEVPEFSGKQSDWELFKDQFKSIVVNKPFASSVKVQLLLRAVKGDAAKLLKGTRLAETNFDTAWEKLSRRYDNPRLRLRIHLEALINLPSIKEKSAESLAEILNLAEEAVQGLKDLECPVDHYDCWLVHLIVRKFDAPTRENWTIRQESIVGFSTYKSIKKYIEDRIDSLNTAHLGLSQPTSSNNSSQNSNNNRSRGNFGNRSANTNFGNSSGESAAKTMAPCVCCKGKHHLHRCQKFLKLSVFNRFEFCKSNKLCINCLRPGHFADKCSSIFRCTFCQQPHHSKLHMEKSGGHDKPPTDGDNSNAHLQTTNANFVHNLAAFAKQPRLLATARIILQAPHGQKLEARALIDPGSDCSFVADRVVQALNLPSRKLKLGINTIGNKRSVVSTSEVSLTLLSKVDSKFSWHLEALVLPQLTALLPSATVQQCGDWSHLEGLTLADPEFFRPAKIDCLLGTEVYSEILRAGLRKGPSKTPTAQNTALGWILTGGTASTVESTESRVVQTFHTSTDKPLSEQLSKYFEVEDLPAIRLLKAEEKYCEDYFLSTVTRTDEGRFIVRLPFAKNFNEASFSDSRDIAVACLLRSERQRRRDPELDKAYSGFMVEYEQLGHMGLLPHPTLPDPRSCYLPHHAVFRKDTKKIRVVLNASQKTGTGKSLNNYLLPGPNLQNDLTLVIFRWRMYRYVFTADIVKMFRQILVHPDDWVWQRIVWRALGAAEISDYALKTVTYGTVCAPYLAMRVLRLLAEIYKEKFPLASFILWWLTYMDDAFGGADTLSDALVARNQLVAVMESGCMELGKWAANHTDLLADRATNDAEAVPVDIEDTVSTLGLNWSPRDDEFFFKIAMPSDPVKITKRTILSEVARLFDPLGWLAPFLIQGKILLRDLWQLKFDWDTPVDGDPLRKWLDIRSQIPELSKIRVKRWLGTLQDTNWQLHGFGDASDRAYAAAIYLVIPGESAQLIMAKTRVAPVKSLCIPKLELCAAVLTVKLIKHALADLQSKPSAIFCWCDNKTVLDWLADEPARWQTFVANRVSFIQTSLPEAAWSHVVSEDNSADCATRGISVDELHSSKLWWNGPEWLVRPRESWPQSSVESVADAAQALLAVEETEPEPYVLHRLEKFSSFAKVIRILAYMYRWRFNARRKPKDRNKGVFDWLEIKFARISLFRVIQRQHFAAEIKILESKSNKFPKSSDIRRLCPFLDEKGTLRVGGRLQNAPLPYSEIHPVILSSHSPFVKNMVREIHLTTLHGGIQLMLSDIHRWAWIPRLTRLVQSTYKSCVTCARFAARPLEQQMAPLPSVRITSRMPFEVAGVDFAGPIKVLFSRGRGAKSTKGYFCIFVCMFTRATHVEVVSDLTSTAFVAAVHRLVSRRGRCTTLCCDNAKNFVGAEAEIKKMFTQASAFSKEVAAQLAPESITWNFSPPRAPHFGGLWEAAVRSFKYHLKRVVGDACLTFEEYTTLSSQIEACLNSRPLCPLSTDGNDLNALTPGHFLIGRAVTALPEPFDDVDLHPSPQCRWRQIQRMRNNFWDRWRKEVMHHLQQRGKWLNVQDQINVGDLVLVKDELTPPTKWPMARVVAVHPGKDGLTRVVDVRTATTTYRRALCKLIKLPVDPDDQDGH